MNSKATHCYVGERQQSLLLRTECNLLLRLNYDQGVCVFSAHIFKRATPAMKRRGVFDRLICSCVGNPDQLPSTPRIGDALHFQLGAIKVALPKNQWAPLHEWLTHLNRLRHGATVTESAQ